MKLHIITIGMPKLDYAKRGWQEYLRRLKHYHEVRVTHLADKSANDSKKILTAAGTSYKVALEVQGQKYTSEELSEFLEQRARDGREVCFIIGGPNGLPADVRASADMQWGLSKLTFPHDLAMVILAEALYRASTITKGHPYHK